jgi:hypothetical protein
MATKSDIVQAAEIIAKSIDRLADAISIPAGPYQLPGGKKIDCLVESLIYVAEQIGSAGEEIASGMNPG